MTGASIKFGGGLTALVVATFWSVAPARSQQAASDAALTRLVDSFTQAQRDYDPAALARLTTPDYVEVSPIGDVDTREEVLGFYAPEKKRPARPLTVSEYLIRRNGNDAVVIVKLGFTAPGPNGTMRALAMRASFVARRTGQTWRLASAHYTPVRAPGS